MSRLRRRYVFHGRVQGVGFRATTRSLARGFAVAGTVRNLADGTVEVVAEGAPAELDAFVAAIQREFAGYLRGSDHTDLPLRPDTLPLTGFVILP